MTSDVDKPITLEDLVAIDELLVDDEPDPLVEMWHEMAEPVLAQEKAWSERLHPRDAHGRFAHTSGNRRLHAGAEALRRLENPRFEVGERVRITSGYWAGMRGRVVDVSPEFEPGEIVVHTESGAEGLLRPDEIELDAGQHTFRGHGPDAYFLGELPVPVGNSAPSGTEEKTPKELRGYGDAIRDGVRRHPEILTSNSHLARVGFYSQEKSTYDALQQFRMRDMLLATVNDPSRGIQTILINDQVKIPKEEVRKNLAPADSEPYGLMTHEIGHAFANAHGIDHVEITRRLLDRGIKPDTLGWLSKYARAAGGAEAFAELYAQEFTPGFRIPNEQIRARFRTLVEDMQRQPSDSGRQQGLPIITLSPKIVEELNQAEKENVKAGDWVAKTPELDALRSALQSHSPPTAGEKAYDPREARDWHGRWTAHGGLLGTPVPPRGPRKFNLDSAEVVARLTSYFDRNPTANHDAEWYETSHNQIGEWVDVVNAGAPAAQHVDPQTFTAVVAACSANEEWDSRVGKGHGRIVGERTYPNLKDAVRAVLVHRRNPDAARKDPAAYVKTLGKHPGVMPVVLTKSLRLLNGESADDVLNGYKERSFYNDLAWPGQTDSVAIDRHAARALTGEPPGSSPIADQVRNTPGGYVWALDMYRRATAQINADQGLSLTPDMVQAAVWAQYRREHERQSRGGSRP